jgi:competence protein ComGC
VRTVSPTRANDQGDRGFTLVEIVVVVVTLAVLAVVVAFSVGGSSERDGSPACDSDATALTTAADVYMTQESVDVLPAIGTSANRYELFLIDVGFIEQVSILYDLQEDGTVIASGEPCT